MKFLLATIFIITLTRSQLGSTLDVQDRHKRQSNRLDIKPAGPHNKPVGKNLFFTCKAEVSNPALVRDLKWLKPNGQNIPEDDRNYSERVYTEEQPGDAAIMLFIKNLREEDSGNYICQGIYANNEQLKATVEVSTFIGITWEDAPTDQNGVIHTDYKIRCVVKASPPATIDWLKESLIVSTGDRYVIESDGLLIKHVTPEDAGTYTCRARVSETGNLEERDIKLEVQIPPEWAQKPGPVKGIEQERTDFECAATGVPHPYYTWVDFEGRDATEKDGWTLEKDTGHLIAYRLKKEDEGKYICIAENNAGRIEAEAYLDVIIKPRVQELYNKTFAVNKPEGKIVCKASGDPVPEIIWRKWSKNEPFIAGGQPDDDRIYIENRVERAPDYTETGEVFWRVSELIIHSVQRKDDGLYECQAKNEGGQYFKSGHIQVEFAPTFEEQPMYEQWSWDQNPVNLTCIATGIPNATITWWVRDREINREIIDRNMEVIGHGPRSDLIITPLDLQYYGRYTCKAVNPHGEAFFEIDLKEAREPSYVQQAVTDKVTATTIMFRFIAPTNTGGLPIDSYAVEYKEATQQWQDARRRVWPASSTGFYVLEGLQPKTTYDFRFGAKNLVGFSEWGAGQQFTMPQRGPPEPPIINTLEHQLLDGDVLNLTSPDKYELVWYLPEDNGEPIDFFEISFFPVTLEPNSQAWTRRGDLFRTEVPHPGNVRYIIQNLYPNTNYLIEIRAHNHLGFSPSARLVVKTARGSAHDPPMPPFYESRFDMAIIIGSVIAFLLLGLCLIDFICCKTNNAGLMHMMTKKRGKDKTDGNKNNKHGKPGDNPRVQGSQNGIPSKSAKTLEKQKLAMNANISERASNPQHIYDQTGEEEILIGKQLNAEGERLFKPSSRLDQTRGFAKIPSKVAKKQARKIHETRSEQNLDTIRDEPSGRRKTPKIVKANSEWMLYSQDQPRVFPNTATQFPMNQNDHIYATPSLPSILFDRSTSRVPPNEHYYSTTPDFFIDGDNRRFSVTQQPTYKFTTDIQKPKPILKHVIPPTVPARANQSKGRNLFPDTAIVNILPKEVNSTVKNKPNALLKPKEGIFQRQYDSPPLPKPQNQRQQPQPHEPVDQMTITVNMVKPQKSNGFRKNSSKGESPLPGSVSAPKARPFGSKAAATPNSQLESKTILSNLGKLTESSRLLAHSSENLIIGELNEGLSDSSSKQTPSYNGDDDELDLKNFKKTRDFGDFQILTDSPQKSKTNQRYY